MVQLVYGADGVTIPQFGYTFGDNGRSFVKTFGYDKMGIGLCNDVNGFLTHSVPIQHKDHFGSL